MVLHEHFYFCNYFFLLIVPFMSFYPDFLETHFIQILSRFNPDFMNFFVKILQIGPLVSKSG